MINTDIEMGLIPASLFPDRSLPESARADAGMFFEAKGKIKRIGEPEFQCDLADRLEGHGKQIPPGAGAVAPENDGASRDNAVRLAPKLENL